MKNCVVIYNPNSGRRKKKDFLEEMCPVLEENGYNAKFIQTKRCKDTISIIQNLDYVDLVICMGGDGTLNEAIQGNRLREKPLLLSYLPIGTTNDVGTMYGYTKNLKKDLSLLLDGIEKNIDVVYMNEQPFLYVACFGNYVDISYETPRKYKEKYGRFGYTLYGLKKIRKKIDLFPVHYVVDGKEYEGDYSFIFITNSNRIAGVNGIYDYVKLDDNLFEVVLCKAKTRKEIVRIVMLLLKTKLENIPGITFYRTKDFSLKFENEKMRPWCMDGEEYETLKKTFSFHIEPGMRMLVPRKNVKKLFEH